MHTVADEGIKGIKDFSLIDLCKKEKRALITFDLDFSDIRAHPPQEYCGIVVLRLKQQGTEHVLSVFRNFPHAEEFESISGQLWIMEENRIRIHESDSIQ